LKLGFSRFAKHLPLLDGTIVSAIKLYVRKPRTNTCHLIVKNKTQRANLSYVLCTIASMENFSGDLILGMGLELWICCALFFLILLLIVICAKQLCS
jgi:hypothetical protein